MSLAVTTSTFLTIIDAASLKRHATSCDAQRTLMTTTPKAITWSPDNGTLYLATSDAIHSLAPPSQLVLIYSAPKGSVLQPVLVSRDKSTLIFAQGSAIHLLAVGSSSPKITSSLIGHSSPITSLSLCNDASLLASSSNSGTLCVHNLAHNSLTVLKGLPNTPGGASKNMICAFHPHTRTRLLVGFGKALLVYDTTRPSGPIKTIPLTEKEVSSAVSNIGHVVAISCSPFSKTLTAVAFNSGFVALVDLEKDRPFFKNIQLKAPVTSMMFTPDGSSIVLGTENGKVIIKDLRSMEHDHRTLPVADEGSGERIIGLAIQRRIKHMASTPATTIKSTTSAAKMAPSLSAPLASQDLNNSTNSRSPGRRIVSSSPTVKKTQTNSATPLKGRTTKLEPSKRTFSPPKVAIIGDTSGDISVQLDTLMGGYLEKKVPMKHTDMENLPVSKPRLSGLRSRSSTTSITTSPSSRPRSTSIVGGRPSSRSNASPRVRSTRLSGGSVISPTGNTNIRVPSIQRAERSASSHSVSRTSLSPREPAINDLSKSAKRTNAQVVSGSTRLSHPGQIRRASSASTARTPTPELPSMDEETPLWKDAYKRQDFAPTARMVSTPEIEQWVEAGKGKQSTDSEDLMNGGRKHVGFADSETGTSSSELEDEGDQQDEPTVSASLYKGKNLPNSRSDSTVLGSASMTPLRRPHISPGALQLSPLRNNTPGVYNGGQDLLRAVVNDIMYEYRQETKEDIKGLHLDLLRVGRSWKSELRTLMQEYVGDLKELREENMRLRKENDRLRQTF